MKFIKEKNMRFSTMDAPLVELAPPVPAGQMIPEWFTKLSLDVPRLDTQPFPKMGSMLRDYSSHSIKKCPAVVDYFTEGFIIPFWYDMLVQRQGDVFHFETNQINSNSSHLEFHNFDQLPTYPFAETDYKKPVKFTSPWFFLTPPGWSTLFLAPQMHPNKDFTLIPGIVETDTFHQVNFPSVWHSEGDTILKRGDPFLQVIPFKREKIGLDVTEFEQKDHKAINDESFKLRSKFNGGYRDMTRRNKK